LRLLWPIKAVRVADIGAVYGRSKSEMDRRAVMLGIWSDRRHPQIPVYSVAEFTRLWLDEAVSRPRIAARFGMSLLQVWVHAQKLGLPDRKAGRKRSVAFGPLFASMWQAGVLRREMARHFCCSLALIGIEADRQGLQRRVRGVSQPKLTLIQFREWQIGQAMARHAAEEQAVLLLSEMVDLPTRRLTRPAAQERRVA
jgi:hypothetical protein